MSCVLGTIDADSVERFQAKTIAVDGGCVIWLGELDQDGYGRYAVSRNGTRKRWMAHRFAYALVNGEIPPGMQLDHLCRTRSCVNPDHLEAVTPRENHDRWTAAITHCPHGHEYTPENTRIRRSGARSCRCCERQSALERYWRARGGRQ